MCWHEAARAARGLRRSSWQTCSEWCNSRSRRRPITVRMVELAVAVEMIGSRCC